MSKKLVAEFMGTFTLIFIGAGSIMTGKADLLGVSLATGFAIAIMIAAVGGISGGHFNPALTFGFLVTKRISVQKAVQYWIAQFIGAAVAAWILKSVYASAAGTVGGTALAMGVSPTKGVLAEGIGTFLLMVVVIGSTVDKRGSFTGGLPVGLTIAALNLVIAPLTGAALNPARWFGPALVTTNWSSAWVWIVGPIVGAVVAALSYEAILNPKDK
jgi:MIP family channel proteins